MRAAVVAFVGSAIFLAGVLVGAGASEDTAREVPVAIALVDEARATQPSAEKQDASRGKGVEREVHHGEADDHGGHGEAEYEYEHEDQDYNDNSGPGSENSGSGSDDSGSSNSGSGSSSSGSGSSNSGSGSGDSGSSGSGSDDHGGDHD